MTTDRVSDDRLLELIAEASDPEALVLLIGKPEAQSAFSELLALREAVKSAAITRRHFERLESLTSLKENHRD